MSEAVLADTRDDPSPLRRALALLPRATAERTERDLLDAVDHYHRTKDDGPLNRLVLSIVLGARAASSPDFRAALEWSDAHPEPDPRPLDHAEVVARLRA